jgi:hypothetical protein
MSAQVIPLPVGECPVCGYPALRPDGHADWCGRIARRNREDALEALMHDIVHPPLAVPPTGSTIPGESPRGTYPPVVSLPVSNTSTGIGERRDSGFFDDVA